MKAGRASNPSPGASRTRSCNGATSAALSDVIWMCCGDQGVGYPDRATHLANVASIGAANQRAETGPRAGPSGLGLTLGYNRGSNRVFADGVFANGAFTNR